MGLLVARANDRLTTDQLVDAAWPGVDVSVALGRLQVAIHRLRRLLDDHQRLECWPGGYRLNLEVDELDVLSFESKVTAALRGESDSSPDHRLRLINEALELWQGVPFQGLDGPDFTAERDRLTESRSTVQEERFRLELSLGRSARVLGELTDAVSEHPLREGLHGQLMIALQQAGRSADALRAFRDLRQLLVAELGVEPGSELQRIHQLILAGECAQKPMSPASDGSEPVAPVDIPPSHLNFTGREAELAALDDQLIDAAGSSVGVCVITGMAGIGKSELALQWSHRRRADFPDGQIHVELDAFGAEEWVDVETALGRMLQALGVSSQHLPAGLADRRALLRSRLRSKRVLILLDNAGSVEQVRPLLPAAPGTAVIVTSRRELAGLAVRDHAKHLRLSPLSTEASVELLTSLIDSDDLTKPALRRLAEHCARLPLALRILAERIRVRPDLAADTSELERQLRDRGSRLDLLALAGDPHSDLRTVFTWSYGDLDAEAAGLFRLLACQPEECDLGRLAACWGRSVTRTRRVLDQLVEAHLVEPLPGSRYRQHELVRIYAEELASSTDPASTAVGDVCLLGSSRDSDAASWSTDCRCAECDPNASIGRAS
ncbi:MAG TPA: BTAD domain-containing putative transcriptional regulator [Microlunatus sp.]